MEINLQLPHIFIYFPMEMLIIELYPFLKIKNLNLNWELASNVSEAYSY